MIKTSDALTEIVLGFLPHGAVALSPAPNGEILFLDANTIVVARATPAQALVNLLGSINDAIVKLREQEAAEAAKTPCACKTEPQLIINGAL